MHGLILGGCKVRFIQREAGRHNLFL
jgi:hypothetical protein